MHLYLRCFFSPSKISELLHMELNLAENLTEKLWNFFFRWDHTWRDPYSTSRHPGHFQDGTKMWRESSEEPLLNLWHQAQFTLFNSNRWGMQVRHTTVPQEDTSLNQTIQRSIYRSKTTLINKMRYQSYRSTKLPMRMNLSRSSYKWRQENNTIEKIIHSHL